MGPSLSLRHVESPYAVLGVDPGATLPEIKVAWRSLAFALHPDRNSCPQATMQFKSVQRAWTELRDRRGEVDARIQRLAEQERLRELEARRREAARREWHQRLAQAQMQAELRREMAETPRRKLVDVRLNPEWNRENARAMALDVVGWLWGG